MRTLSGKLIDLEDFKPNDVDLYDVAQSLSNTVRFNGHVSWPYTVAEHCILISRLVHPDYSLEALLHDAAEAYTGDIIRPLKNVMGDMGGLEDKIGGKVFEALYPHDAGGDYHKSPEVSRYDENMGWWESWLLRPRQDYAPREGYDGFFEEYARFHKELGQDVFEPIPQPALRQAYINEYHKLYKRKV